MSKTRGRVVVLAVLLVSLAVLGWFAWRAIAPAVRRKPQATAMPEASLPWNDDFSDPTSGWQTESDATAEVGYQDGALRVLVKASNRLAWAFAGHEFTDFRLAVEATQVGGPDDNEYGVLVRMEDTAHFYRFSISGDGYYRAGKYSSGEWTLLNGDWTPAEAIRLGAATNLLEVVCQGATMTFLVNGVQLFQVEDADYRTGDVGLYAGSFFEPEVEIHFDNLRITQP